MERAGQPIESILAAAVEIDSDAERREFVDEACGDDAEWKKRVLKLIDNHFRAGSFLAAPSPNLAATFNDPVAEGPGTLIGPYKLLEQIGEGGMGVVWMAEQTHPVQRKVALKVIKPGMDSRQGMWDRATNPSKALKRKHLGRQNSSRLICWAMTTCSCRFCRRFGVSRGRRPTS